MKTRKVIKLIRLNDSTEVKINDVVKLSSSKRSLYGAAEGTVIQKLPLLKNWEGPTAKSRYADSTEGMIRVALKGHEFPYLMTPSEVGCKFELKDKS